MYDWIHLITMQMQIYSFSQRGCWSRRIHINRGNLFWIFGIKFKWCFRFIEFTKTQRLSLRLSYSISFFFVQWNQWNLIKIVFENVTLNWFCHLWNFPKYFYECVWRIVTTSDELNTHASMHKRWYHWTHIKLQTWQRCVRCCTIFKHFRVFSLRFWSLMSTTQTSI